MMLPNISEFIKNHVTNRKESFFHDDLINNKEKLISEVKGKSILVIGSGIDSGAVIIIKPLPSLPPEVVEPFITPPI